MFWEMDESRVNFAAFVLRYFLCFSNNTENSTVLVQRFPSVVCGTVGCANCHLGVHEIKQMRWQFRVKQVILFFCVFFLTQRYVHKHFLYIINIINADLRCVVFFFFFLQNWFEPRWKYQYCDVFYYITTCLFFFFLFFFTHLHTYLRSLDVDAQACDVY